MSSPSVTIGTEIASPLPLASQIVGVDPTQLSTINDLLDILRSRGDKNISMLRTTAMRLSEFMNEPIDRLSIEVLVDVRFLFSAYLKERRYSANSVRAYCQNSQRLLRCAKELGWVTGRQSLEEVWSPILDALKCNPQCRQGIIRLAIQNGRTPADFAAADLEAWGDSMLRSGRQYRTVRQGKWHFRKAVAQAGVQRLLPKLEPSSHRTAYRVRATDLPEPLRSEVRELLTWKQARFSKGRPQWTRHRPVSAKLLESNICRLFGFAINIGNFASVDSLSSLFTERIVTSFVEWGLNERNLSRSSLFAPVDALRCDAAPSPIPQRGL